MLGVVVMLQLHVVGGEASLKLLADPSANYKNKALISPCRLFNEAEPFQPLLPKASTRSMS